MRDWSLPGKRATTGWQSEVRTVALPQLLEVRLAHRR